MQSLQVIYLIICFLNQRFGSKLDFQTDELSIYDKNIRNYLMEYMQEFILIKKKNIYIYMYSYIECFKHNDRRQFVQ